MAIITRGARELSQRFDTFPTQARQKIAARIADVLEALLARVQGAAPYRTGRLRSEITSREYTDNPDRVAGYVQVYAPDAPPGEYAKAATLEYGTDKPRRIFERPRTAILARLSRRRAVAKMTRTVHIAARRYLRGPFEEMRPEIEAALEEAVAEAGADEEGV